MVPSTPLVPSHHHTITSSHYNLEIVALHCTVIDLTPAAYCLVLLIVVVVVAVVAVVVLSHYYVIRLS